MVATSLSILLYLFGAKFSLTHYQQTQPISRQIALTLALGLHGFIIASDIIFQSGLNFNLLNSFLLTEFLVGLILFFATWRYPVYLLDMVIYPMSAFSLLLTLIITPQSSQFISYELASHIILSMVAYAILALCVCQSVLLQLQDKQLHHNANYSFINKLPPLQTMESLLFLGLLIGTILLTLSLLTGFVFLENVFAQHLLHKTVLSIVAWLIFSGILLSHWLIGFRGRQLRKLTQIGFVLLLLGYFGSKFVLEVLIN